MPPTPPVEELVKLLDSLTTRVAALEARLGAPIDPEAEAAAFAAAMEQFRQSRQGR